MFYFARQILNNIKRQQEEETCSCEKKLTADELEMKVDVGTLAHNTNIHKNQENQYMGTSTETHTHTCIRTNMKIGNQL